MGVCGVRGSYVQVGWRVKMSKGGLGRGTVALQAVGIVGVAVGAALHARGQRVRVRMRAYLGTGSPNARIARKRMTTCS
jgi:hypothetical protein